MARIDYYGVISEIRDILKADETLSGVQVTVEGNPPLDSGPWIAIYLTRREAPEGQPLAVGTRTRMRLRVSIWCWQFSLESSEEASRLRDDLISKVEIALMGNRTINDKVAYLFLEGGQFMNDQLQNDTLNGWVSGGEIALTMEAVAIT